jgi:uncharacterized metal-binding protein YceD (DUF177 family)
MEKKQNLWSVPVVVEDIPETGFHVEADAPESVCTELAALAGLRGVSRLSAVFDLARRGDGVRVTGRVSARVGQTCVVTLEPIESDLQEPVDLVFVSLVEVGAQSEAKADDEPPEPLVGGKVDVGSIATEFLLLGINPYPRKAGAEFAPVKADNGEARPFAGLEALKKRLGGG